VVENDRSLKSRVTQWFLHHELVTDPERAEAWHYFAMEFLPKHEAFSKDQLLAGLTKKLSPHSMQHFGPGSKLNKQILRKIIQVYTGKSGLGELGLIEPNGGRIRGQRFRRTSGARTVTSERKFDKYGDWHYVKSIALGAVWLATNHEALREYAQMYWYDDRA
jgi:hypothetical protein